MVLEVGPGKKGLPIFLLYKDEDLGSARPIIREIFNVFDPEHITELELNAYWTLLQLAHFAPYCGHMKNLQKVFLAPLHKNTSPIINITSATEAKCVHKIISPFSQFNCLQDIFMKLVHFLRD